MSPRTGVKKKQGDGALGLLALVLLALAVRQELRRPSQERTWHGDVHVAVPYELRPPTLARARSRLWDPSEPRLFVPTLFGVGWTINLARVLRRGQ